MRHALLFLTVLAVGCGDGEKTTDATESATQSTSGGSSGMVVTTGMSATTGGSSTMGPTTGGTTEELPDGQCRVQEDCSDMGGSCVLPGSVQCGGATGCNLDGAPCVDDPACGGTPEAPQICVQDPCCGMGICQPGCLGDGDCGLAQRCGPEARCVAAACDAEKPCPTGYACAMGTCAVKPCSVDSECEGYCVLQQCSTGLGICELPAP
jgi:hypothetical protein